MFSATFLNYFMSKDLDKLIKVVHSLKYKIEIKGMPQFHDGKWRLFFTLAEQDLSQFPRGEIGIDLDQENNGSKG